MRGAWWKLGSAALMVAATWGALAYVGPAKGFMFPDGARLILFHVPCAWVSCVAYVVAAKHAAVVLRRAGQAQTAWRGPDAWSQAAMEVGLLFSVLTTVSGSVFSHQQWGVYWSWDPRQTSIVVIMLLFAAYMVLRGAVEEPVVRARLSAAYALVAVVPGLFLIWVLPRIVTTLHGDANSAVLRGGLDPQYRLVLYTLALPAFLGAFAWCVQLRARASLLEWRGRERSDGSVVSSES